MYIYDFLPFCLFPFSSFTYFCMPSQNSNCRTCTHTLLAVSNSVFAFVPLACDDECSGLLISDMDRLYRIITEVTLTTPLPPPYKVLYRFENMTDELKVRSVSAPVLIQYGVIIALNLLTSSLCL